MKKLISLLLAVVLIGCTFAACGSKNTDSESDLAYIKDKGTLVIGITEYAPMNYKEEGSAEWTGFDTEYA